MHRVAVRRKIRPTCPLQQQQQQPSKPFHHPLQKNRPIDFDTRGSKQRKNLWSLGGCLWRQRLSIRNTVQPKMRLSCLSSMPILLARIVTIACTAWACTYLALAGTSASDWFKQVTKTFFDDSKGGNAYVYFSIPIVIAGTLSTMLVTRPQQTTAMTRRSAANCRPNFLDRCLPTLGSDKDTSAARWILLIWIVLPTTIYLTTTISHKIQNINDKEYDNYEKEMYNKLKESSNTLGMAAIMLFPLVLVPVARHSILVQTLWTDKDATYVAYYVHIWMSRLMMTCAILHGILYIYQWLGVGGESLSTMIFPTKNCWIDDKDEDFECYNSRTSCSCYNIKRNLMGFVATLGFAVIFLSSLGRVRRFSYKLFYWLHIWLAPISILLVVLHWNRSIVYLAGGVLYYMACSFPLLLEAYRKKWQGQQAKCCSKATLAGEAPFVRVVALDEILPDQTTLRKTSNHSGRVISLTLEASPEAMALYCPGQYVQLHAPTVSMISHPFTVNTVVAEMDSAQSSQGTIPPKKNLLRIMFRVMGPFTSELASQFQQISFLQTTNGQKTIASYKDDEDDNTPREEESAVSVQTPPSPPPMFFDGFFYGSTNRLNEVLQHDTFVMVAGGIGITPFLSLLHQTYETLADVGLESNHHRRSVSLYWMCRDSNLIEYIKKEYFLPLQKLSLQHREPDEVATFAIEIAIHHTGSSTDHDAWQDEEVAPTPQEVSHEKHEIVAGIQRTVLAEHAGVPFALSKLASGDKPSPFSNLPMLVSFSLTSWIGLWVLWYYYSEVQEKHAVWSRFFGIGVVTSLAAGVAIVFNCLGSAGCFAAGSSCCHGSNHEVSYAKVDVYESNDHQGDDDNEGMEMTIMRGEVSKNGRNPIDSSSSSKMDQKGAVSISEKQGRPEINALLCDAIHTSSDPGILVCGPESLARRVKQVVSELQPTRCSTFRNDSRAQQSGSVAVYTESFEF